jgi:probable rRNA maturation factor
MNVSLEIAVSSRLWRGLPRARPIARETVIAAAAESEARFQEGAEVSLCLADDAALRALNSRWREIDSPTNVLSFPAVEAVADRVAALSERGYRSPQQARLHLGDIALAFETLKREAAELAIPLADHYRHLVAHGFLHLIGYDHETDGEAERMEALETRILTRLGAADPYARLEVGG